MNVSQENISNVSAVIKVTIAKADFEPAVEKTLRGYRQKANIPGFRKGMAPMGMIKKMYGKQIQADEINKLIGEQLYSYIRENNLNVLGEPMPSQTQEPIDFDSDKDLVFCFDVAIAPEFSVSLSKEDKIPFYNIEVTEDMVSKQVEALQGRFGTYEQVEVAEEKDMLKGDLAELDENGNIKEGGIFVEGAALMPNYYKNEEEKAKFAEIKKFATVDFNPMTATENNASEVSAMLKMKKEDIEGLTSNFRFTVNEITHYVPAELGEELYKNVFGEDVKTEEEFKAKVREMIVEQLAPESDYKFGIDSKTYLLEKVGNLDMPVEILKRWMVATNENRTAEQVEEEMPKMLPELTWHLVKEKLVKDNNIKVEESDIMDIARRAVQAQLAQYGMSNIPDEMLDNYAKEMLKNKETARNLIDRATEEKIIAALKGLVTLEEKAISVEDFYKMFENK